ncbi:hypothetical protein DNK56_22365 [Streptomyces sp. AC1-42W]|nr:hypothetical protein DNK56_22365 [Streptomyces sp. AC1-42W]PZT79933.1 hypothetical protein DNK55_10320 [Streptomyces sp. AC1-42T]
MIKELLGHAQIGVTATVYIDVRPHRPDRSPPEEQRRSDCLARQSLGRGTKCWTAPEQDSTTQHRRSGPLPTHRRCSSKSLNFTRAYGSHSGNSISSVASSAARSGTQAKRSATASTRSSTLDASNAMDRSLVATLRFAAADNPFVIALTKSSGGRYPCFST